MGGRAFFTSIPKCGKNLITTLFDTLGIERINHPDVNGASAHVMARWTLTARSEGRWLEPRRAQAGLIRWADKTQASLDGLTESLRSLERGYVHAHLGFDAHVLAAAQSARVPVVFLYRDPRAMLASQAHYLLARDDPAAQHFRPKVRSLEAAYALLVDGDGASHAIADVFGAYEGWLSAPGVLAVRFEDLVGPRGGGSVSVQLATVARIAQHIGWSGSSRDLLSVAETIFNPRAGTFRRGTIGGWRDDIPATIVARFPEFFTDLPGRWGYGDDGSAGDTSVEAGTWEASIAADGTRAVRAALARARAESDERLALMRRVEERLEAMTAACDHLRTDNDSRLELIERLQRQVGDLRAANDHLRTDNDSRLELIQRLHGQLEAARDERDRVSEDSDQRLALIHRLQAQLREVTAERDLLRAESDQRLAIVRRLEARFALAEALQI